MALVKCFECGREISSSAKVCSHCGYKGFDGYWFEAGQTASFAAKFGSRLEALRELSKDLSRIRKGVRESYGPGEKGE